MAQATLVSLGSEWGIYEVHSSFLKSPDRTQQMAVPASCSGSEGCDGATELTEPLASGRLASPPALLPPSLEAYPGADHQPCLAQPPYSSLCGVEGDGAASLRNGYYLANIFRMSLSMNISIVCPEPVVLNPACML